MSFDWIRPENGKHVLFFDDIRRRCKMNFEVEERYEYTVVRFKLDQPIEPSDLAMCKPPEVKTSKGVVLSGRGPIWLFCFLAHYYHPTVWVATYDPRLEGAVVVESHCKAYSVGQVVKGS